MAIDSHPGPKPAASAVAAPQPPRPSPLAANPALRMLGLPSLPRKLPSRNWTIFWAVTGAFTAAVVYDKREKKRATARWRRAVQPLAAEPIASASQLPRKLTIYLEAPPGDGLRAAQDHFVEYVKPVLAASGLDWDFVQGRQQGDVRAAVAEKIRRARMAYERPGQELPKTDEAIVEDLRTKIGVPRYEGPMGDIVIGRHTWKEYVRGLHEGWLGPLDLPPRGDEATADQSAAVDDGHAAAPAQDGDGAEEKPRRPRQPPPYNAPRDYAAASLPALVPDEFAPSSAIPFPHRLGFSQTPVRLARFLNRRKLADHIGREVAAVCWAASREWRDADGQYEQQLVLVHEEADWPKSVWKTDETVAQSPPPAGDLVWPSPVAVDARIAQRMRRFQIRPDDAQRAAAIAVPEEDVEGWIKGSLRSLWRWSARSFESRPEGPKVGDLDDS